MKLSREEEIHEAKKRISGAAIDMIKVALMFTLGVYLGTLIYNYAPTIIDYYVKAVTLPETKCEDYKNYSMKSLPVRCINYWSNHE